MQQTQKIRKPLLRLKITHHRRKYIWAYLFILPQFLYFLGSSLYPIIMSYVYSFYEWDGLQALTQFIGLANYAELLKDNMFWNAMKNTTIYGIGSSAITVVVALLLALVLNDRLLVGRNFYRTLYFLPVVTTSAIIGIIMNNIFGLQGFVNELLLQTGLASEPVRFWLEPSLAMLLLIVIGSWKQIGVVMIYWLAGLQTIPNDLYEAARIDGANSREILLHITMPLLKPVSATILLLTVGGSLHVFDLVTTLTGGGPYHKTETLELFIYQYAFSSSMGGARVGYASAAGVLLGLFTLIISLIFGWMAWSSGDSRKVRKSRKGGIV